MSNVLRDYHYKRLNDYRESREYAEYAKKIGLYESWSEHTRVLIGKRWEINEQIYNEFLNMLPPVDWRVGSFKMREFCFGSITTKYTREGDRFYCEFVDVTLAFCERMSK